MILLLSPAQISQQQQRQLESGIYEQQIYISSDLVGLAIGREGSNVNEVRKLEGIVSVEFDDYSQMFKVRAKVSVAQLGLGRRERGEEGGREGGGGGGGGGGRERKRNRREKGRRKGPERCRLAINIFMVCD